MLLTFLGSLMFVISLSSCATILDVLSHYYDCAYPGCPNKAKRGSCYCIHHDYGTIKGNIDKSLEKIRKHSKVDTMKD